MQHFNKYQVVVFDVDGTILDTSEGILNSVRYTIDFFGLEPLSDEKLIRFIGPPIQNSFSVCYGFKGAILQEIANVFRNHYKDIGLLKAVPYKGIYDMFEVLLNKGIETAIATYKRQDYAEKIVQYFGFDKYTRVICGADNENKLKKKDIIEEALKKTNVCDWSKAVMVGDSDNDARGARDIGIDFIGVTYGFGFKTREDVNKFPNQGKACDTIELQKILTGEYYI